MAGRWLNPQDSTPVGDLGEGSSKDETQVSAQGGSTGPGADWGCRTLRTRHPWAILVHTYCRSSEESLSLPGSALGPSCPRRRWGGRRCGEVVLGTEELPNHSLPGSGVLGAEATFIF